MYFLENDHHMQTWAAERASEKSDRAWLRWVNQVEDALGHDLDGNDSEDARRKGTADGYSLDGAFDCFNEGWSAAQYVQTVRANPIYRGGAA